ncbi:hypothetical protein [Micromonospora qiuiae]|nr:hypothetical protein [Micromonospora qiuiae]
MRMSYEDKEAVRAEPARRPTRSALPAAGLAGRPSEMALLALQRAAGNAAVVQRMAGPLSVQRATLIIRPSTTAGGIPAGTISGVSGLRNRPPSNLHGSQGQHLTAYVVFEDAIRSAVVGRTPQDAATALIAYLTELRALPGMTTPSARYLDPYLDAAEASLVAAENANASAARDIVGAQIDEILTIRNHVPGTAQRGVGGGHGEGNSAGIVREVERNRRAGADFPSTWGTDDAIADQVRHMMWRLLDYDPPPTATPKTVTAVLITHYRSLWSAYPYTFDWLTAKNRLLRKYLIDHHGEPGLPLRRWTVADLKPIFDDVHAGL